MVAAIAFPTVTLGKPNSAKLKIGWIGGGGRGSGAINQALAADSNIELHAIGEAFQDKAEAASTHQKYHPGKISDSVEKRMFVGIDAYQKVIDSGVDVVLLATPDSALNIKAAVDVGKHVFAETYGHRRARRAFGDEIYQKAKNKVPQS